MVVGLLLVVGALGCTQAASISSIGSPGCMDLNSVSCFIRSDSPPSQPHVDTGWCGTSHHQKDEQYTGMDQLSWQTVRIEDVVTDNQRGRMPQSRTLLTGVLACGLPVAVLLAWFFSLGTTGHTRRTRFHPLTGHVQSTTFTTIQGINQRSPVPKKLLILILLLLQLSIAHCEPEVRPVVLGFKKQASTNCSSAWILCPMSSPSTTWQINNVNIGNVSVDPRKVIHLHHLDIDGEEHIQYAMVAIELNNRTMVSVLMISCVNTGRTEVRCFDGNTKRGTVVITPEEILNATQQDYGSIVIKKMPFPSFAGNKTISMWLIHLGVNDPGPVVNGRQVSHFTVTDPIGDYNNVFTPDNTLLVYGDLFFRKQFGSTILSTLVISVEDTASLTDATTDTTPMPIVNDTTGSDLRVVVICIPVLVIVVVLVCAAIGAFIYYKKYPERRERCTGRIRRAFSRNGV